MADGPDGRMVDRGPIAQAASVRARPAASQPGALKVRMWGGDKTYPLTLREAAAAADPVTRTFLIKADAGKLDVKLGQSATVVLDLPQQAGIVKLPLAAVLQQGGKTSVWVLDAASMTVKPVPVQVAGADGNEVVVAAGLNPGQEVVVAGVHVLNPGQKVKRYVPPRTANASTTPAAPAASR